MNVSRLKCVQHQPLETIKVVTSGERILKRSVYEIAPHDLFFVTSYKVRGNTMPGPRYTFVIDDVFFSILST